MRKILILTFLITIFWSQAFAQSNSKSKPWQKQETAATPSARIIPGIAFDSKRDVVVMFGGDRLKETPTADTWEYDGKDWKKLSDTGINLRSTFKLIHSKKRNSILLFGGFDKENIYGDVWEWKNGEWKKLDVPEMPKMFFPGVTFDTNRNRLVMFGQSSPQGDGETWELDLSKIESAKAVSSANRAIMIDGTLSEDEWKDAKKIELTNGGEAFYKFAGDKLFIGIRGVGEGWITIYATDGKDVYALHASAALGTAIYKSENGSWKNTQGFKYVARDVSMSAEAIKHVRIFIKQMVGWLMSAKWANRMNGNLKSQTNS